MTHRHNIRVTHQLRVRDCGLLQHRWNVTPAEAIEIQEQLRHLVIAEDQMPLIRRVGGVDVHFAREGSRALASVAILSFPEMRLRSRR
jgi:deoxyribonuclease V